MKKFLWVGVFMIFFASVLNVQAATLAKGLLSFTFDDGYKSVYTYAYPALNARNFKGTAYIISGYVGYDYAVSWAQLKTLWNNGWEIGNHTMDHPDLVSLNDAEVIAQIRGARSVLENFGLVNVTALAAPYGSIDARVIGLIGVDGTLYSNRMAWPEYSAYNEVDTFDQWQITVIGMDDPDDLMNFTKIKPYIDAAISKKAWLVLMFHDIVPGTPGPYQFNSTEFTKVVTYAYQKRSVLDVVTVTTGVGKMLQAQPVVTTLAPVLKTPSIVDSKKPSRVQTPTQPPANLVDGRP